MDDQEMHDLMMSKCSLKVSPGRRKLLEAALMRKQAEAEWVAIDPIDQAILDNPGLIGERALEVAERLGLL